MANLLRSLLGAGAAGPARANETVTGFGVADWARMFSPGHRFNYGGVEQQSYRLDTGVSNGGLYSGNSIVFACELRRMNVFSEARFQYQRMQNGRAGDLWGDKSLASFETPWPGGATRQLLKRAELDAATSGNSYWIRDPDPEQSGDFFLRLDYRWTNILTQAVVDPVTGWRIGEQLLGYIHCTDGNSDRASFFAPEDVAHFAPIPDPDRPFRGMSWLNPCLPDIDADHTMTRHKLSTLKQGGALGYVVSMDASMTVPQFRDFVEEYRREHQGPANAGKTVFLGGGADIKTVGQSLVDLELKALQGAGETRIAACSGVPSVVVGLSEGMQGSSLNAGNYKAAKENFVDGTVRPNWGEFAGAFESLSTPPPGSRLWFDDRDIPFLREDITDQASVMMKDATTVAALVNAGYEPDAAVMAVASGDIKRLTGQHTGYVSVQLQQPGSGTGQGAPAIEGNP